MPEKYTLLTGGLGFIGSHTAVELSQQGKPIILVDNLSNSNLDVFFKIQRLATCDVIFYQTDILDTDKMQDIFTIKQRREGDRDIVYCDASKIERALGWKAEKSLKDICKDAWNFAKSI